MLQIFYSGISSFLIAIIFTPILVRFLAQKGWGQEIRIDGPKSHFSKRGTPSMGGIAIVLATVVGYFVGHVTGNGPSASGLLILGLTISLGCVGFLDDYIKVRKGRNLGLTKSAKFSGQFIVAIFFAYLTLKFPNKSGISPASLHLSFIRDIAIITFPIIGFLIFVWFVVSAWSNAVNFTDGLDGLVSGCTAMVLGSYVIITFWQYRNSCSTKPGLGCYQVRDSLDLAILAVSGGAACLGFLWWNAAPAKIWMGDTGSLALGGLIAGISILSQTELLMIVVGALFVAEMFSVVLQIIVYRTSKRRLFKMAPFHHHFELSGWAETTVTIRFWLLTALSCGLGLGLFYNNYLSSTGFKF